MWIQGQRGQRELVGLVAPLGNRRPGRVGGDKPHAPNRGGLSRVPEGEDDLGQSLQGRGVSRLPMFHPAVVSTASSGKSEALCDTQAAGDSISMAHKFRAAVMQTLELKHFCNSQYLNCVRF